MTLGLSTSLVGSTSELGESIARDERELPEVAAALGGQNEGEPYRRKLSFVWWRLGNDGYASPDELAADLDVIDRSLRRTAASASRTAGSRGCGRASSSSGSTSRGSTCGSTRATSRSPTNACARPSPPSRAPGRATERMRSTP